MVHVELHTAGFIYIHVPCVYTNDEGNINPTFIYMERTNIKHIVFEFHTYIMWSIYMLDMSALLWYGPHSLFVFLKHFINSSVYSVY